MANFSALLKSEIARLARKEIKATVEPLRKANAAQRRQIAELKRDLVTLQKATRDTAKASKRAAVAPSPETANTRFSVKGLKSLRARLELSAADFGRLAGASGQSVYNWEAGKTVPAAAQRATLASLRGLGKREAAKRLEAL
ncbi:hypothetical protein PAGU2638_13290 [Lysobacter sp. PAGU 2638]